MDTPKLIHANLMARWAAGRGRAGLSRGTETITITKGATLSPAERLRRASQIRRRTQRTQERCVPFDYFAIHTLVIVIITMTMGRRGGREQSGRNVRVSQADGIVSKISTSG